MTENPWKLLAQDGKDYVLEIDKDIISKHNIYANENYRFHLELLPEPFIGNMNSNIIALNANPGLNPEDYVSHTLIDLKKLIIRNLLHNYQNDSYFYYLRSEFDGTPGARWWRKRLRILIDKCGKKAVSDNLFVVELIGYHSEKYKFINLPSQEYSCHLITNAMTRGSIIVIMRCKRQWYQLVPGLKDYNKCYIMNNPQATYFSPNNLDCFDEIAISILNSNQSI